MENIWNNETLILTSVVFFLHESKVATLTQVKAIYSQPYSHMFISASQWVRNIGITVFYSIAVFARLRHLDVITNNWEAKRALTGEVDEKLNPVSRKNR